MPIFLQPSRLGNILKGAEEQLNLLLFTYSKTLRGVIVSYSDVKVKSFKGKMFQGLSHVEIPISVKFLLYSPSIGSLISGRVNKVGPDFLGLITEGVFNISVARDRLSEWIYSDGAWKKKNSEKKEIVVKSGVEIDVVVLGIRKEGKNIFIEADLPRNNFDLRIRYRTETEVSPESSRPSKKRKMK
eukprot:CAMPEP_0167746612 /NCGR_PEP_ID=MMETSP0110_2-20121227/3808_1 /TAXON_ID=629695 /ORGANISM="Gymnochlora sp., Strain CCMP2014" /LENGTH=185 /DNA_ID=CAMNT_0007631393 /DNA_START=86 /DNA_END=643 /DNA_ORIENTATION=-